MVVVDEVKRNIKNERNRIKFMKSLRLTRKAHRERERNILLSAYMQRLIMKMMHYVLVVIIFLSIALI